MCLAVEGIECNLGGPAGIPYGDFPWIAAHFAVFHILLRFSPARIERDRHRFAAVRAGRDCVSFGCAVAEGEVFVDIVSHDAGS